LRRVSEIHNAASEATAAEKSKPLFIKIKEWWNTLPPEERLRPYSMCELVAVFKVAPSRLGMALTELGWKRSRSWNGANYRRWWRAG